jgi:hypothetical protein
VKNLALLFVAVCLSLSVHAADLGYETLTLSSGTAVVSSKAFTKQAALSCSGGAVKVVVCKVSAGCTPGANDTTVTNFDLPYDVCIAGTQYVSVMRTGSSTVTCVLADVDPKTCP